MEATSSASPDATLTVTGIGGQDWEMVYDAKKDKYSIKIGLDSKPAAVTVSSSKGGSATTTSVGGR